MSPQTRDGRFPPSQPVGRPPAQQVTPARVGRRVRFGSKRGYGPLAGVGSFLGREGEVRELVELLERVRLVTLTGAPGIGKSRLALALAGELDGAELVELSSVSDPALVPAALAAALSVPEAAGQSITDTLVARLSRRRVLLVLDNCEHLIGACAELVDALLGACPDIRVLATSREPLALDGECVWQVPPLAVPSPGGQRSPEALAGYAGVALFIERASAVQPGFALNAYVAPAVAEICRRLDGIPLSIELAAARVESLTPEEIARRLDGRFSLLTSDNPGVLARHQTLQAALDWSHDLLSSSERALLRRLSVFVGGFELEAAEAVCSSWEAEAGDVEASAEVKPDGEVEPREISDLLTSLLSKSLVGADPASRPRYRLLETIRVYAGERLEEVGDTALLRAAHARFYLTLAERAEPELTGAGQQRWLERLEAERANLRSALEWSLSHGREEWALRLGGALVLFWRVRCHFSEGRKLLDAAVSAGEGAPMELRAKALWGAGFMTLMTGERDSAIHYLETSLSLFREVGDRQGSARALLVLANCRQYRGDPVALSLLEESAALARDSGDAWCLDHALALAGFEHCARSELPAARPLFEECLLVSREAQEKQGLRFALMGLGSVALCQGDYYTAESLLNEAVCVTGELGEDFGRAVALQHLGELALRRGDYAEARELLEDSLHLIQEIGVPWGGPRILLAKVAHAAGDRRRARDLFGEALVGAGENPRPIPALQGMGELAAAEGDVSTARRLFEEALELARGRGEKGATAEMLHSLGRLARSAGAAKRAAVLHDEALELECEIGGAPGIVASLEAFAGLAADAARYEHAARLMGAAKALREENDYARAPWEASGYEADLALVRARLPASALKIAFANGAALSVEQAAAQASKVREEVTRPAGGRAGLTTREQEVAALVAGGLTNPEIAERLFISRGTVKRHLAHIFRKLGLGGRMELARAVWDGVEEPVGARKDGPPDP